MNARLRVKAGHNLHVSTRIKPNISEQNIQNGRRFQRKSNLTRKVQVRVQGSTPGTVRSCNQMRRRRYTDATKSLALHGVHGAEKTFKSTSRENLLLNPPSRHEATSVRNI